MRIPEKRRVKWPKRFTAVLPKKGLPNPNRQMGVLMMKDADTTQSKFLSI